MPSPLAGLARRLAVLALLVVPPFVYIPAARSAFTAPKTAAAGCFALAAAAGAAWAGTASGGPAFAGLGGARWAAGAFAVWLAARAWGAGDLASGLRETAAWWLALLAAAGAVAADGRRARAAATAGAALTAAIGLVEGFAGLRLFPPDPRSVTFTPDRIAATLGNPDTLAAYLAFALPLAVSGAMDVSPARPRRRALWLAAAGLQAAALILTSSRAALAATVPALGLLAWGAPRGRRVAAGVLAATLLIALAAAIAQPAARAHWAAGVDAPRRAMWRGAAALLAQSPLAGAGTGQFGRAYPCVLPGDARAGMMNPPRDTTLAHSDLLQFGGEWGLPALGLWLFALAGPCLASPARDPLSWAARAGALSLALQAAVSFPLQTQPVRAWLWLLPALWLPWPRPSVPSRSRTARGIVVAAGAAALLFALADLARSGWYFRAIARKDARDWEASREAFDRSLRLLPDSAAERIGVNRAIMLFEAGHLGEAERSFEEDLRRFPCSIVPLRPLAVIHVMRAIERGAPVLADARALIGRSLAARPFGPEAAADCVVQGAIQELAGDPRGARASYAEALRLDPANARAAALLRVLGRAGTGRRPAREIVRTALLGSVVHP